LVWFLNVQGYDEEKTNKHADRVDHLPYDDGYATDPMIGLKRSIPFDPFFSPTLSLQEGLSLQSIPATLRLP
jgi:hypothetical protein